MRKPTIAITTAKSVFLINNRYLQDWSIYSGLVQILFLMMGCHKREYNLIDIYGGRKEVVLKIDQMAIVKSQGFARLVKKGRSSVVDRISRLEHWILNSLLTQQFLTLSNG